KGESITPCWPCGQVNGSKVCAAGSHSDVAAKFCSQRKHGDEILIRTPLTNATESTKLAVKLVELTIDEYEKRAHDVGGKVDSITISKDGMQWNSRKKECPEGR